MKKLIATLLISLTFLPGNSQALDYHNLAIEFSKEDSYGSARFVAMGGAFGALGGDVSSATINPAGLTVFTRDNLDLSYTFRNTSISSNYYNSLNTLEEDYNRITSAGVVILFDLYNRDEFNKVALSVNYRILKDFRNAFYARGNSNFASFDTFPYDINTNPIIYNQAEQQEYSNNYHGQIKEINFSIAANFKDVHFGASLNTHSLTFIQQSLLSEENRASNGDVLNADFYQENNTSGSGFSLSLGVLYKINQTARIGLSYHTPTWYTEIDEITNITNNDGYQGDTEIRIHNSQGTEVYNNTLGGYYPSQRYIYQLHTPSKWVASTAFVFGKFGLISADYTYKNYNRLELKDGSFNNENNLLRTELKNTHNLNLGTEWRINQLSLRGGFRYSQSPYENTSSSHDSKQYSIGIGYNFGNYKINLAYTQQEAKENYNFYPQYSSINHARLKIENKTYTLGISYNL